MRREAETTDLFCPDAESCAGLPRATVVGAAYERFSSFLFNILRAMGINEVDAEDIAATIWADVVYEKIAVFHCDGHKFGCDGRGQQCSGKAFGGWLKRIARNKALEFWQRPQEQNIAGDEPFLTAADHFGREVEDRLTSADEAGERVGRDRPDYEIVRRHVILALAELPPTEKAVLTQFLFAGEVNATQIAGQLGKKPPAVRKAKQRGLAKLQNNRALIDLLSGPPQVSK